MSERYLTDLDDVLVEAGLKVICLNGWMDRARGSGGYADGRPTHVMAHHTASPPSMDGRPDAEYCAWGDEDAPLSNLYLDRKGTWWVLAAGATNTNGKGGPIDCVPKDSMNTWAIGVEAGNNGVGEPWPQVQQDCYVRGVRALCSAYGCGYIRGHAEWAPDRKVDPAGASAWAQGANTWNMDAFRADVHSEGGGDEFAPEVSLDVLFAAHNSEDQMFICKDPSTVFWLGNQLVRRKLDDDDIAVVINSAVRANQPLVNFANAGTGENQVVKDRSHVLQVATSTLPALGVEMK